MFDTFLDTETASPAKLEQNILSVLLYDAACQNPERIEQAFNQLSSDSFQQRPHRTIFGAMIDLKNQGQFPDLVSVAALLDSRKQLDDIGADYLNDLGDTTPLGHERNWPQWIQFLQEAHTKRNVLDLTAQVALMVGEGRPVQEVLDRLLSDTQRCMQAVQGPVQFVGLQEAMLNSLSFLGETAGQKLYAPTGLDGLDRMIEGGIGTTDNKGGRLIVLAGRPAMGKSMVSSLLALGSVANGASGLIYSFEMDVHENAMRYLSHITGADSKELRQGAATEVGESWTAMTQGLRFPGTGLKIRQDEGNLSPKDLCREVALEKSKNPNLGFVVIDHLGLIAPNGKGQDPRIQTSEATRLFKQLSKHLHIDVVLLSQLNRGVEAREDKRPILADLRESGSVEQDANIVVFCYRDAYYKNTGAPSKVSDLELIIAKNRSGTTGTIYCNIDLSKARIREMDYGDIYQTEQVVTAEEQDLLPLHYADDGPVEDWLNVGTF